MMETMRRLTKHERTNPQHTVAQKTVPMFGHFV